MRACVCFCASACTRATTAQCTPLPMLADSIKAACYLNRAPKLRVHPAWMHSAQVRVRVAPQNLTSPSLRACGSASGSPCCKWAANSPNCSPRSASACCCARSLAIWLAASAIVLQSHARTRYCSHTHARRGLLFCKRSEGGVLPGTLCVHVLGVFMCVH